MSDARVLRLGETFDALAGPLARLRRSLRDDAHALPDPERPEQTDEQVDAVDAFLQRFQQTADLTLRKLFPRLLAVLEASDTKRAFASVLDRLDGYEVIDDVAWWTELNSIRNRLIHEYAMEPTARAIELARSWSAAGELVRRLDVLRDRTDLSGSRGV